jgi:8-oxo-dGTP pyrophosphatase MutT (NUDIX family)
MTLNVIPLERLDLHFKPQPWPFAEARRAEIDAHFAQCCRANPHLWNGEVLVLHEFALDGAVLRGAYLKTDFASFLAWRDWGFPDRSVHNCFGLAALRAADGAFLAGIMASHTANAGKIYFAGGTPDPDDIVGDAVDLAGSVLRELTEETGLPAAEVRPASGWHAVFVEARFAMLKILDCDLSAASLRERILGYLRQEAHPELADIHIVRGPDDLDSRMPPFMAAFFEHVWRQAS